MGKRRVLNMKKMTFVLVFCLFGVLNAGAENQVQNPAFWWSASPAATLPLGLNSSYFSTGVTVDISGEYVHPAWLGFAPLLQNQFQLRSTFRQRCGGILPGGGALGAAYRFNLFGPFSGRVFADLGYSFVDLDHTRCELRRVFFREQRLHGGRGWSSYALSPNIALRLDAFYTYYFQLYGSLSLSLGVAFTTTPQQGAGSDRTTRASSTSRHKRRPPGECLSHFPCIL